MVKLLLDNEPKVHSSGGYYGGALQAASVFGYKSIVRLLPDKRVEINASGGEYGSAL